MKGAPSVQCCLRLKASQPGAESDSTQEPAVPLIQFGLPIPNKSSLPTENEQAAQGFDSLTNFEVATNTPELNQPLLPDAVLAPADNTLFVGLVNGV